jgi:heme oxygenase
MRDLLERELLESAANGDTTVLAELLGLLSGTQVFNALSDSGQALVKSGVKLLNREDAIDELAKAKVQDVIDLVKAGKAEGFSCIRQIFTHGESPLNDLTDTELEEEYERWFELKCKII